MNGLVGSAQMKSGYVFKHYGMAGRKRLFPIRNEKVKGRNEHVLKGMHSSHSHLGVEASERIDGSSSCVFYWRKKALSK